ncbi:hypothetical protein F441_07967 [Phytophthora nicotianae CJ01A1]|uniref:Myb-like domain-containing protein n=4 Tax=Phytophthora nicotianae TaxID=4792 RepID=W2J447_PHYNI|nr:hypothetical protein L915_07823 [Phytophthora nicotianae]ETO76560.1 hypothetical protein F444_08043 [Phytophthora nicotianae P1976]ETP17683.1 hypothetical protein F441_07967 [Phytophthora nicotianae CJ01A1]KUF84561.1 hypothetical protein AM587_10003698 [Phytophthora nicotianae]ETL41194.1 hypothetical protein L916_07753 [Phytophthora nicotianae]
MPPKQRTRQRFGPSQDYLLVVQVNTDQPFRAPYGGLMAGWEKIATTLNGCSAFKMHHLKGPIAKNRFERLVERHRNWVKNGSHPDDAPSQDTAFQSVMVEVIPKLEAAEKEPQAQTLGKRGRPRKIRPEDGEEPAGKKPVPASAQVAIAPSPLGPQPSSTSLLVDSEDQALPTATKATRQRFTPGDDLLLIKFVKESLPFRAKFGAISAAWEDVAAKLDNCSEFSKDNIKGPIVRYRFENLVSKYRERVKRNNGRVVGPKGVPAGELEVLMTELVSLLDGGDPVSAAQLAQSVAIATGTTDATSREVPHSSTNQDEDSTSSTPSESSSPAPTSSQSFVVPTTEPRPAKVEKSTSGTDPTNIAELKALIQEMVDQQTRTTEQMVLLQREERRLEAERRERALESERAEREKDRQALTSAVMSVMKTFLEENGRKN